MEGRWGGAVLLCWERENNFLCAGHAYEMVLQTMMSFSMLLIVLLPRMQSDLQMWSHIILPAEALL